MSRLPTRSAAVIAGVVTIILFRLSAFAAMQQSAPQPTLPDVQKLGPQVGTRVPDFTLLDQKGQSRTLASLMGPKGLMLVFYRSADWCPYCKTQLAELQTRTADLAKNGIGLAAVSYDAVPVLADFSKRRGITFPLLVGSGIGHHQAVRDSQHDGARNESTELRHSVSRHVHAEHPGRGHVAFLRAGLSGAEHGRQHHGQTGQQRRRAGDHACHLRNSR